MGRSQGVVGYRSRVGAHLLFNQGHFYALGPNLQLLNGSGPKGVRRPQHHRFPGCFKLVGQFANGSGFAYSVNAYHHNDIRFFVGRKVKIQASFTWFSASKPLISSLRMRSNSSALTNLSRATRFSMRWIILRVVSTPTSELMSISSSSSNTSSSTLDLPTTTRASFCRTLSLVLDKPWSSLSFFALLKTPNIPMIVVSYLNSKYNHI